MAFLEDPDPPIPHGLGERPRNVAHLSHLRPRSPEVAHRARELVFEVRKQPTKEEGELVKREKEAAPTISTCHSGRTSGGSELAEAVSVGN